MALDILRSRDQVARARAEMRRRGIDCASSLLDRSLRRFGLLPGVNVGDRLKSWDVLKTIHFIEERLPKEAAILDLGAHECEILPVLHRLGYVNLAGVDLNPRIREMPHAGTIRYIEGDFMNLPRPDAPCACVTAISVIEHGLDRTGLLRALSRILSPGGYFLASVDYWPEKIDTSGLAAYGLDWTIFSRADLLGFVEEAKGHGFVPVGEMSFDAGERIANWNGKRYTFAWLALRRAA